MIGHGAGEGQGERELNVTTKSLRTGEGLGTCARVEDVASPTGACSLCCKRLNSDSHQACPAP